MDRRRRRSDSQLTLRIDPVDHGGPEDKNRLAATRRPPKGERPLIRSSHADRPGGGGRPAPKARPSAKRAAAKAALAKGTLPKGPPRSARGDREERGDGEAKSLKKTKGPPGVSTASDEAREIAITVAVSALEKKASGLEVIDVSGKVDYADFLVLMSGRSDRHVTALSSAIEEALRKRGKRALAVEGLPHANWVLMDFGDVVVHVFQDDARAAYDIDGLWMDARRVPVPLDQPRET
jgi:ribosome-associated protein